MKNRNLYGKTVVITGASAGIGRETALKFAEENCRLALISRNETRLKNLEKILKEKGIEVIIFAIDVADHNQMFKAANKIKKEFQQIDIWVNNAMTSVFSAVHKMKAGDYKRVTEVTYLGTVYGTLAALNNMDPNQPGTIIQVGSALAYRGIPLQSAYCAAKHAVQGFNDSLRAELIHEKSKIHVTMIQLSAHNTPQFDWVKSRLKHKAKPVPPIFSPEVAAKAIIWSAKHRKRRELIVGWPALKAIWGNKFFPGIVDHYLAKKGYKSQQTTELENPDRPHNLYNSVEGNFKSNGRFTSQEKKFSIQYWININFSVIFIIIFLAILLLLLYE